MKISSSEKAFVGPPPRQRTVVILAIFAITCTAGAGAFDLSSVATLETRVGAIAGTRAPWGAGADLAKGEYWLMYDDGTYDNGLGSSEATALDAVMRFDLATQPAKLSEVRVGLTRLGSDSRLDMVLTVWEVAATGEPGRLIGQYNAIASNVPLFPDAAWFSFDLSEQDLALSTSSVFIGVGWTTLVEHDFFLLYDESGSGFQPGFVMFDVNLDWFDIRLAFPSYSALLVRAKMSDTVCTDSTSELCFGDRFKVHATYAAPNGLAGDAHAVRLTSDSGYLWFFDEDNVEVVLKVLDGCAVNGSYWIFAAGLTNVEVRITVEDTLTGEQQSYVNQMRTPFVPVQDTHAFATCP